MSNCHAWSAFGFSERAALLGLRAAAFLSTELPTNAVYAVAPLIICSLDKPTKFRIPLTLTVQQILFPTCSSVSMSSGLGTSCYINIAYNKQLPLCASSTQPSIVKGVRKCRPPKDLSDNDAFARFPLSSLNSGALLVLDTSLSPVVSLLIKRDDANLDRFPDLLLIVDHTPKLMFSVPCEKGVTSCAKDGSGKRGCHVEKKCAEVLDSINVRSVSFVGMDEDVRPFFAYANQVTYVASKGRINNFYYDAFFLRVIVLNGHSVVPRLVIIASDVHYWMTIKKDVIASARILVKFSDKDYYCTREYAESRITDSLIQIAQRSLRLIPATPRPVFASAQRQLSERRILFLECPMGDARCNISSVVSSQSLVDYGYDFALRSMIFMARAPFRGPGKEVGSSEDESLDQRRPSAS
ncbi:hypothetical protein EDD85DRAFT_982240 [Armillaria nabsnona]|nr:hypothetical protein EDD85DRAFT_982240 [Armillaria nabsnona]